jgi:hypothetical protein
MYQTKLREVLQSKCIEKISYTYTKPLRNSLEATISGIYPSAKEPVGLHGIRIVSSRHVESIILMTKCGSDGKN